MSEQSITVDGVTVYLYRSKIDGIMVVDVDTTEADESRDHFPSSVPKLRLWVNECEERLQEDGGWVRMPPLGTPNREQVG